MRLFLLYKGGLLEVKDYRKMGVIDINNRL